MCKKLITQEKVMKAAKILAERHGGSPEKYMSVARRMLIEVAKEKGLIERKGVTIEDIQKETGKSKEEIQKDLKDYFEKMYGTNED